MRPCRSGAAAAPQLAPAVRLRPPRRHSPGRRAVAPRDPPQAPMKAPAPSEGGTQSFSLSVSPLQSLRQASCVSATTSRASARVRARSWKPKLFSGFSSGVLYHRNHSRMPDTTPRHLASTSPMSWSSAASGSSVRMQMTFQSSSPSSIIASTPRTFTGSTAPWASVTEPISTTSTGSLSPEHLVTGCSTPGSSQVCGSMP
mmetsp:Transcript_16619/g.52305  ORF Transcript_16619/g.52305 Transcript_16619/m.52305 type:complete len:201 (-) Transcript_16619:341-943(-)